MAERTGRNDPCPCGSGKKYKRCCMAATSAVDVSALPLRRTDEKLSDQIFRFASAHYPPEIVFEAWDEFTLGEDESEDPTEDPEFTVSFVPWFAFNWVPDDEDRDPELPMPAKQLALEYLDHEGARLSDFERRFLLESCRRPFSFYVVTGAEPGRRLYLRDILTRREFAVFERSGSRNAEAGDILFARVLEIDGAAIVQGCGLIRIPPEYQSPLLDLREEISGSSAPCTEEDLHEYDIELREEYFAIVDSVLNPSLPRICNTDGEKLVPTTLRFDLRCSPREAFDAVRSLSLDSEEEMLDQASRDREGNLHRVQVSWQRPGNAQNPSWDNTLLGSLVIDEGRLTVDVNSEERADRIRAEIDARLGERAVFKAAVIQSVEKVLEERSGRPETAREQRRRKESEDLAARPEVQAALKEMAEQHWRSWPDLRIPALKDQTPREAARTPEGRERLEALLLHIARSPLPAGDPFAPDVDALRRELGL
jgi:hypothetical protein